MLYNGWLHESISGKGNVVSMDKNAFIKCFMMPSEFVIQAAYDIRSAFEAYCNGDVQRSR